MRRRKHAEPLEVAAPEKPEVDTLYPWSTFAYGNRLFVKDLPVLSDDPAVRKVIDELGAGIFYRYEK